VDESQESVSGILLKPLPAHLRVRGLPFNLIAVDDYAVKIPIVGFEDGTPITASHVDVEIIPISKNGPY